MKKLNANHLKLIAIIAMTIDHIADLMYPGMPNTLLSNSMHIIGRLTAPIMFFFICEGFYYTKDLKKYITRLFVFAILSHFAYCFAFGISYIPFHSGNIFNQTSILWSLAWSVVALSILNCKNNLKEWHKFIFLILINIITFPSDWSCIAVMAIVSMYSNRGDINKQLLSMSFWIFLYAIISYLFVSKTYGILTLAVVFSYPLLKNYNGEKGKLNWMKWFFYLYYPFHLLIIGIVRIFLYGNIPLLF